MSPTPSLSSLIGKARRSVQRDAYIALVAAVVAIIPATLLIAWVVGAPSGPSRAPFVIDVLAIVAAVALGVYVMRRWVARFNDRHIAAAAENKLGFAEGELQGVIEMHDSVPVGTSKALWHRTERRLAA